MLGQRLMQPPDGGNRTKEPARVTECTGCHRSGTTHARPLITEFRMLAGTAVISGVSHSRFPVGPLRKRKQRRNAAQGNRVTLGNLGGNQDVKLRHITVLSIGKFPSRLPRAQPTFLHPRIAFAFCQSHFAALNLPVDRRLSCSPIEAGSRRFPASLRISATSMNSGGRRCHAALRSFGPIYRAILNPKRLWETPCGEKKRQK